LWYGPATLMLHTLLRVTLRPVHLQEHICTILSMLSQDCASWNAQSPQLHAFSHLLLGCCDAKALRCSREDVFTVLNSVCFLCRLCLRAELNEKLQATQRVGGWRLSLLVPEDSIMLHIQIDHSGTTAVLSQTCVSPPILLYLNKL
jgi:hypothetical protein